VGFASLAVARMGVGVGEAGGAAPSYSIISDYFPPEKRGVGLAIFSLGVPLGTMLGAASGGWIAAHYGWRTAFFVLGGAGVILAPLIPLIVREPARGRLDLPRGAKVVVNDLGGSASGTGASTRAAEAVVEEIRAVGGQAMASTISVTDYDGVQQMVEQARSLWGKIDILVNNAGILRDKSFSKMSLDDFRNIIDVHLMGSVHCTKAVWNHMKDQGYGRIVLTTSSSGLYGNFGQANYGAAKLALVGLMQTLALEGAKYNVRVNCIAPSAGTRMLDGLMPEDMLRTLHPGAVSPGVLALVAEDAPTRTILCAGGGSYEQALMKTALEQPLDSCLGGGPRNRSHTRIPPGRYFDIGRQARGVHQISGHASRPVGPCGRPARSSSFARKSE
jgi:NAD(P)-dependent dehydrogenase (short-subunit alcohol dehydrogenase family)